jgi:hypothetical protein
MVVDALCLVPRPLDALMIRLNRVAVRALGCTFAVLAAVASLQAAEPFAVALRNASFEEGMAGAVPAGWRQYAGGGKDQSLTLVKPAFGQGLALLLDNRDAATEMGVEQQVATPGGTAYRADVDVAALPDAPAPTIVYLQVRFLPSNTYVQRSLHTRSTAVFETLSLSGAMPAEDTSICIYLYTHKGAPQTTLLMDNVRLTGGVPPPPPPPPETPFPAQKAPPVTRLKELHLLTPLVAGGRAVAALVAPPGRYDQAVALLQAAIRAQSGCLVPVLPDHDPEAALPLRGQRLILGNRSTNRLTSGLYDAGYTVLDLKYPGLGGAVVQSLHNPYGNGCNALLVGGSDDAGVQRAAALLAERIKAAAQGPDLDLGWIFDVRLPDGVQPPADARQAETWDASEGYGSSGYFGWNSLSKCMAMYFMTGDAAYTREFLRLAFPDKQAFQELCDIDGERLENKDEPLAGAYHYNQHMTMLYWDLIEESPCFTDEQRLRITNALARQLEHPDWARQSVFALRGPAARVSSRHGQWAAVGIYCLGRYFNRDYPDPVWEQCEKAGAFAFGSLHEHANVDGENDNLFWYSTGIAPIFTYLCLTGDRVPVQNGTIAELLRGQEILLSGVKGDAQLRCAALSFLHQAAYLTGDGRWLGYRQRLDLPTDVFRLGQSYWPSAELQPAEPADLCGQWSIQRLPLPLWTERGSGIPLDRSFFFGSFRTETGPGGDFVLLDGFNGASRNPYHTFAVLDLRLDGARLLQNYLNQVLTKADGMVEPAVAMDAGLRYAERLGQTATACGVVPRAAFCTWQRTLVQRLGRYALLVDDLEFRADSDNLAVQVLWETCGGRWLPELERATITASTGLAVPPGWRGFAALDAPCTTEPAGPERLVRLTDLGIVLLRAQAPGERLEMPFHLDQPFAGEAFMDTVKYLDRGLVRVLLDGRPLRDRLNLYADAATGERLALGPVTLPAGDHVLQLEVVERSESSPKCYAALAGLLLQPADAAAAAATAGQPGFALSTADPLEVQGSGQLTMAWTGPARTGERRLFFHLLARTAAATPGSASQRLAPNAALLRLPELALAVCGAYAGVQAELAVLATDHVYGRGLTQAGFGAPLLAADQPVAVDWDVARGELVVEAREALTLSLALADPATLRLAGAALAGLPLALPAGRHAFSGAIPAAAALADVRAGLAALQAPAAQEWERAAAARRTAAALPQLPVLAVQDLAKLPQAVTALIALPAPDGATWLAAAAGKTVHLLTPEGKTVRELVADGNIRVLAWWPEADALLAGCADEKLIAFGRDGSRTWVFTSEMDPEVFKAAKTYWFKSASGHEGIHGLATGPFIDGKSQCIIGSACTVEIVNTDGSLARRQAVFWGPGKIIRILEGAAGSHEAAIALWPNGTDQLSLINSRDRGVSAGFYDVPAGHTMVSGWTAQNRVEQIWEDINADGALELVTAINGTWNRVTTYDRQGQPLHNAQFGPGPGNTFRAYLRDLKTAPWGEGGRRAILTATHEKLLVALDCECRKLWSRALPSAARRLLVGGPDGKRVLVGGDDGSLLVLDDHGEFRAAGKVAGRVEHLLALDDGRVIVADATGALARVALP